MMIMEYNNITFVRVLMACVECSHRNFWAIVGAGNFYIMQKMCSCVKQGIEACCLPTQFRAFSCSFASLFLSETTLYFWALAVVDKAVPVPAPSLGRLLGVPQEACPG